MSTPENQEELWRLEAENEFPRRFYGLSEAYLKIIREAYIRGRMKSEEEINRLKEMLNSAYRELTNKR